MAKRKAPCILYVSSFPPRECGIATFTEDLTNAIDKEFSPEVKSKILAMNPNGTSIYNYPRKVRFQISDTDMNSYLQAAKKINKSGDIKLVNIQHEYGLHGGDWGNYILPFMELIDKPIVVTFHTVLPRPEKHLKKITQDIIDKAEGVMVMTEHARKLLRGTYKTPKNKPIFVIPHGVHHIAYPSKTKAKKKLHLQGRTVLSTFGMLNADKGIEYAIESLPEVVEKHPDVLYLVLGATHPEVVKHEGEKYRNKLIRLVKKLKLEDNVKFYNKYMDLSELIDFLKATDIYISPTLNPKQAVSGTISYALSCACPVIATKNQYAKDTINRERGILVDFENADAIQRAIMLMLDDTKMTKDMKKSSYLYSRHMTWQNVALAYFRSFNHYGKIMPRQKDKLPRINLNHVKNLTDNFGIIQFAKHTKPSLHSGYCLDDNGRALIGCVKHYDRRPSRRLLKLIDVYFNYIKYSQKEDGSFHDFINHNKTINTEPPASQDTFGRAIWSLGELAASRKLPYELIDEGVAMLEKARPHIDDLNFTRAQAFSILGLYGVLQYYEAKDDQANIDSTKDLIARLAEKLLIKYDKQQAAKSENQDWQWFDDHLTYSNYKIPQALFLAYEALDDKRLLRVAEKSISFLSAVAFDKDYYNAIGQDGWYFRNGKRAYFDQQPEDASSAVESLVTAYQVAGKEKYKKQAKKAFAWFLGDNHLSQMIYDEATGGCYDGLGKHSINFNQGAESTLSYLLARLAVKKVFKK